MDENRLRNIRIYVVANEIGFIILWLLFLYLFRSDYGEYLIFHGTKPYTPDTTGAYFYTIVAILWMTAPVPLIGIPIMYFSLWKKEDVQGMYRFVSHISFGVSLFMVAVMVFSIFFFDPMFYNADLQVVKNSAGQALTFPRLLIAPLVLTGALMLVSGNNVRKIMPERKAEKKLRIMDENRLRNIKTYVVANEIGFIVLWILSWYLFRSDYGEYLIFHGAKPYTLDTTGVYFYRIIELVWDVSDVPLFGIALIYFTLWKKKDVQGTYRFVSYMSFGVSLFMVAVMVFSIFFFDPTFYNADLQVVKNSAGQALTFPRLLIAPLVLAGVLMLLSGNNVRKIMPERKAEKKLREQGKL